MFSMLEFALYCLDVFRLCPGTYECSLNNVERVFCWISRLDLEGFSIIYQVAFYCPDFNFTRSLWQPRDQSSWPLNICEETLAFSLKNVYLSLVLNLTLSAINGFTDKKSAGSLGKIEELRSPYIFGEWNFATQTFRKHKYSASYFQQFYKRF